MKHFKTAVLVLGTLALPLLVAAFGLKVDARGATEVIAFDPDSIAINENSPVHEATCEATVAVPRPVVQLPVVYGVAPDNPSLLRAMNEWLLIEKATGGIAEIHDYWVQGKTDLVKPPRWSVIRDVLGWVP